MRTIRAMTMLSTAAGLIAVGQPAVAQQTSTSSGAAAQPGAGQIAGNAAASPDQSEDIIVTAQKREQTLSEVPQSISVLGGDALDARQARSIADYASLVPGLSFEQGNPGETRVVLRGINSGGASPTVAIYLDDTPFGSSTSQTNGATLSGDFDTFDVERLEVLRGPQGTLYGANSLGGVVKYVTVAPKLSIWEGRGQAGIEGTKDGGMGYSANALLNVPLGDTLALRTNGFYRRTAGFIDGTGPVPRKDINKYDSYGGRASLLFRPSDRFSIRLSALLQNIRADGRSAFDADPVTLKPITSDPFTGAPVSGENRYGAFLESADTDYRLYSGTLNYDLGFATFTSVTSYSRLFQTDQGDVTYNDVGGATLGQVVSSGVYGVAPDAYGVYYPNQITQKKFTQEIRLASDKSDVFEWLIGGYYTREPGRLYQRYFPYNVATGVAITPPPALPSGFNELVLAQLNSTYKEIAGFGSATLHLTPKFDITAGGRYSHNKQNTLQILDGVLFGARSEDTGRSSQGVFTWSVSPRYELGQRSEIYARVAKGYRPGGPNVVPPGAPANYPVQTKADTLVSYEAGVRAETTDRTFGIDASLYYLDWKDTLILAAFSSAAGPIFADANGKGARSYGFEVTGTIKPVRGLSVINTVAYNKTRLRGDTGAGGFDGDQLPFAPEWTVTSSADYTWTMSDKVKPFFGADLTFTDDRPTNFDLTYRTTFGRRASLDGFTQINLHAGADVGAFNVSVYARNLTNSRALVANDVYGSRPGGALQVSPIRPRTIGATVGFSF